MSKLTKFLIVPDKFRTSLSASQASHAIKMSLLAYDKNASITEFSMTDGGDCFVDTIARAHKGAKIIRLKTIDPTGQTLTAKCAIIDENSALVGLTEASGINLVSPQDKNTGKLTTLGTGEILAKLVERGFKTITVGVGGTATTDGGIGLLIPLGFKFLDASNKDIEPNGFGLEKLEKIVPPTTPIKTKFIVATDVENPLFGKNGAAYQYSEAKGATKDDVVKLDANLKRLAQVAKKCLGKSLHDEVGAGAGGGCGYALMTCLGAKRVSGFDVFAKAINLEANVKNAQIVITGEGKFDKSSVCGKGPYALAKMAAKCKKPVWILCGISELTEKDLAALKLDKVKIGQILPLAPNPLESVNRAPRYIAQIVREFIDAHK